MKKVIRSICAFSLALALLVIDLPLSSFGSFAAGGKTVPSIRNVKLVKDGITFWGWESYCIYEIDGIQFDSRQMTPRFNEAAWRAMNDADRRTVNRRFWDLKKRQEVFGTDMALEMGLWSDEVLGWKALNDALCDKWEARYAGALKDVYGNDVFQQTYDGLTTFEYGSDAYTVLTNYADDPLAADFMAKYNAIKYDISVGKTKGYDYAVSTVLRAREMAVKSISKELIGIIVSNFMTPTMTMAGPSKAVAATTDLITKTWDLCDQIGQMSGKLQSKITKDAQDTGDAAAWIKELDKIIEVEFNLAQHGYDEARKYREELESEAPQVIQAIRTRNYNAGAQSRQYLENKYERDDRAANASDDICDFSSSYTNTYNKIEGYKDEVSRIDEAIEEATDNDVIHNLNIQRNKAIEKYEKAKDEEYEKILKEYDLWAENIKDEIDSEVKNAGFEIYPEDYQFTQEEIEQFKLLDVSEFFKKQYLADKTHTDYYCYDGSCYFYREEDLDKYSAMYMNYDFIPPEGLKAWEKDLTVKDKQLKREAGKLRDLGNSVPSLFDEYYKSYVTILEMKEGYDDAVYGQSTGNQLGDGYSLLKTLNSIPCDPAYCDQLENAVKNEREGELARAKQDTEAYQQWLRDSVDEYNRIKSDFDLAHTEYCNDLKACRDVVNTKAPQYVRDQQGDPIIGRINSSDINKNLKDEIEGKANKESFLRTESKKLTDLYDEFLGYQRECDIDQSYMLSYYSQMNAIQESLSYRYEVLDEYPNVWYGQYYQHDLLALFGVEADVTFTFDDPDWDAKYAILNGHDGLTWNGDEKNGLSVEERRVARMMPLLAADFSGNTEYHADFLTAYNEFKNMKGTVLRRMKAGDYSLYYDYEKRLQGTVRNCLGCYNDQYAGIGDGKTINMFKETYGDGGIVNELWQKAENYRPVTNINNGGRNRLSSMTMSTDTGTEADLMILPGGTGRLIADVEPANATERGVLWSSLDPEIATVDNDGIVTGIAEGTATIRVIAEDVPATISYVEGKTDVIGGYSIPDEYMLEFKVEVSENAPQPADATSIDLQADKTDIGDLEIATIVATVEPQNASAIVEWSISPSSVAQISSEYDGEWGETAHGWRAFVRGAKSGTATVTAKASNGVTKSIQIKVTQSPVNVLDQTGTLLYKCDDLNEAKTWVWNEWKEKPEDKGTYTVSLNADMVLDETGDDCIDALVYRDVYSADEGKVCITFDLGGNTLTVKRSQYSALQLYTGTTVKNGLLRVEGEDGVDVYGDVHIDNLSASKLSATTAYRGEYFDADTVVLSDWFSNGGQMVSQINNLTCAGGVFCYNNSKLLVDSLNAQDRSTLLGDAVIIVNSNAVFDSVYVNHEEDAYIARYKDASLAINGDIENSGKEVLNIGIVNEKATADNMTEAFPEIAEITPQTLLFKTAKKSVPAFVKIWQPAGASAENKALVTAIKDGGVYAVVKGTQPKPVVEIEKISKLVTDKKNVSIGTGKSVTIKVTAFTGDGDAVNRPQVAWTENKKNSVITIESVNPADGTVTVKGINPGTAALTATATDGSKKKVSCTVKVGASIENIKITQKKGLNSVECGKKLALTADISPKKPAPVVKTLIWTSKDPNVAVVNSKGEVTGISKGSTTIYAVPADSTYDATKMIASFDISVTEATKAKSITSLKVKQGKNVFADGSVINRLAVGSSISFKAYTVDTAKNKEVSLSSKDVVFYSSDEQIVSVTPAGKITAKAEGSATVTVVSLKDAGVKSTIKVNTYVAVKKIELNTRSRKVNKGGIGILTVAQFTPLDVTDQRIKWTATGVDGNTKPGNVQAIEAAVLPAGKTVADLTNTDFKDIRVNPVITGKGDRLVYRTLKATKKCVVTAVSVDGNKKATTTVISNGEVTGLTLKTTKTITGANGNYSVNIKAGKSITIKPVITAEYGADKTLIWSSDNDMITVKNGKITVGKTAPSGTKAVVSVNDLNANCKLTINVTVQ